MKRENFDYQGKTPRQIAQTARGCAYSGLVLLLILIFSLIMFLTSCVPSERFINKDQKKRVKEIRRQSLRSELFYYSDTEMFHVSSKGNIEHVGFNDLKVLGIDSLMDYHLYKNAER